MVFDCENTQTKHLHQKSMMEYDGDGHYSLWDVKASVRGASMIAQTIYRSATLTALRSGRSCLVGQPFETHQQKLDAHQHVPHPMSHQAKPRRVWESIWILVIPRDQIDTPITAALLLRVIAKNAVWPVRTQSQPLRKNHQHHVELSGLPTALVKILAVVSQKEIDKHGMLLTGM